MKDSSKRRNRNVCPPNDTPRCICRRPAYTMARGGRTGGPPWAYNSTSKTFDKKSIPFCLCHVCHPKLVKCCHPDPLLHRHPDGYFHYPRYHLMLSLYYYLPASHCNISLFLSVRPTIPKTAARSWALSAKESLSTIDGDTRMNINNTKAIVVNIVGQKKRFFFKTVSFQNLSIS
mgnify:CR=1 FL=1